ncbi:hypothetical protein H8744_15390 [Oscillospiraceae bacterium N12]|uniref:Uncharacterized protein n=1 Tax=Jilunia laotingensis TaxID=2763675 RepID=A0A926FA16_9BACT|nr:hypothetical protein [Jilunia laotingensis]MBC8594594.1 hypothetical protein [Jilunia laotingensis]
MKKVASSIIKYLLIVFFLYYYIGTTAFVHTHYFDKYTVTHSHPYFPGTHHSHSTAEIETIGLLNMLVADTTPLFSVIFALSLISIISQTAISFTTHKELHLSHLRAPPVIEKVF